METITELEEIKTLAEKRFTDKSVEIDVANRSSFVAKTVETSLKKTQDEKEVEQQDHGNDGKKKGISNENMLMKALVAAQKLLKLALPEARKELASQSLIQAYLKVAEGEIRGNGDEALQIQGLTCVVNSLFVNPKGFQVFENELGGMDKILKIFESKAGTVVLQRCVRILNICIQNLKVLSAEEQNSNIKSQLNEKIAGMVKLLSGKTITCLACCIRCKGAGLKDSLGGPLGKGNGIIDLVVEILMLYILLATEMDPDDLTNDPESSDQFTQLGMLLTEILLIPIDIPGMFQVKEKVVSVLTFMPEHYSNFLAANNVFPAIVEVLERLIHSSVLQGEPPNVVEAKLIPPLLVLSKAATNSPYAKLRLEEIFFGEDKATEQGAGEAGNQNDGDKKKQNMEPLNAKPGSVQFHTIKLTGCSSQHVSALTGEFLFELCGKDTGKFIKRVGVGNGVGLLQAKGLLDLGNAVQL